MTTQARRIALIVDNENSRQALMALVALTQHKMAANIDVSQGAEALADYLAEHQDSKIDLWLVDTSAQHNDDIIDRLFDYSEKPMLVNDELPAQTEAVAFQLWQNRLLHKLEDICIELDPHHKQPGQMPESVWVLAASLGGPAMVKRFLNALPGELPVAFVYAQHIGENFDKFLSDGIGEQQKYPLRLIETEQKLVAGETLVVPADHQIKFLHFGEVVKTHRPWQGMYQPCIDQVACDLAKHYRSKAGVIIFSGTCNDGEIACRLVKSCGGQVWAQSPDSCVSAAMPEAAIETGCVSFVGSPEQLAAELTKQISAGQQYQPGL